jgi:hypothetical protein
MTQSGHSEAPKFVWFSSVSKVSAKIAIVVVVLLVLVVLAVTLPRKSVYAERVIAAEPAEIWRVLVDPGSYPIWNPIFVSVEGKFVEGSTLSVAMRSPDGTETHVAPRVKKIVTNQEINQIGGIAGILTFDHTWRIEPTIGGTKVIQHEEYRGVGVLFWDPAWVEDAYKEGNRGLSEYLSKTN